jgi:hypothetical protein
MDRGADQEADQRRIASFLDADPWRLAGTDAIEETAEGQPRRIPGAVPLDLLPRLARRLRALSEGD